MKRNFVQAIKPIQKRANSKIVNMNGRYFLIGGLTVSKNTSDIYQFRITKPQQQKFQVEWRKMKFQNNIFTARNSFSACASSTHIYIWGGLQTNQTLTAQKCLSSLIQIDIQKGSMRSLTLKQPIQIHSSCLFYNSKSHSLIAYGGTNQQTTLQSYLYTLNLNIQPTQQYEWKKKQIKNIVSQGIIWQHSCNILQKSIFNNNNDQNPHMLIIGGCRYPHSPYKKIVQFNLQTLQVTNSIELQEAVVAHESVYDKAEQSVYIIGGANGGGFNKMIYMLKQGKITTIQGHNAVGCACALTQHGIIVYGGVFMPEMLNDMIIYHQ